MGNIELRVESTAGPRRHPGAEQCLRSWGASMRIQIRRPARTDYISIGGIRVQLVRFAIEISAKNEVWKPTVSNRSENKTWALRVGVLRRLVTAGALRPCHAWCLSVCRFG